MRALHKNLTVQVLVAITIGAILGFVAPDVGRKMKPVGDTFVNLVKMVIAPVVFLTIVLGIANMHDLKKVGRVGGKALLYFEVVTTFALLIGVAVVNVVRPGAGIARAAMAKPDVSAYVTQGKAMSFVDFVTHIVPSSIVDAFARGDMLQVVFVAVLFGAALAMLGESGRVLVNVLEVTSRVFFRIVAIVMIVAPIGAFGAMAYTVGAFGIGALLPLGRLMLSVYMTMAVFIFVVLNLILRAYGFSLWEYIKFIREEILIVLGTSSS
jgi:aerobic C4-dicarboxylate transport protein